MMRRSTIWQPVGRQSGGRQSVGRRSLASILAVVGLLCLVLPLAPLSAEGRKLGTPPPRNFSDYLVAPAQPLVEVQADESDVLDARLPDDGAKTRELLRQLMADDSVVARVNGRDILWGDVWRSAEALPEDYQNRLDTLFPALLQRTIDLMLLADAARRLGLQNDAAIRAQVRDYEDELIRERLLERQIEAGVNEQILQGLYADYLKEQSEAVEVSARHIQLPSREEALEVIDALDDGADFATLASERSAATSASRGGDLGTFRLNRMTPPFADAIARLAPGNYTREPVQTEFGWHVILLVSRQGGTLPSFAELEPELRDEASRRAVNDLLRDLREQAVIKVLPVESDGAPAAGNEAAEDSAAPDATE